MPLLLLRLMLFISLIVSSLYRKIYDRGMLSVKWIKSLFKSAALHDQSGFKKKRARHVSPLSSLSDDERIYATGDIHGRCDLFERILKSIDLYEHAYPIKHTTEVVLGDMIDRGSQSKEVIDLLIERALTRHLKVLRGNHENMMIEMLKNPAFLSGWIRVGGLNTLFSYGISPQMPESFDDDEQFQEQFSQQLLEHIPQNHIKFLKTLELSWQHKHFIFVHAGLRPELSLLQQDDRDLTEIRDPFLNFKGQFEGYVVHGHTPVKTVDVRNNRINVDTGAFATGNLSCVVFEKERILRLLPYKEGVSVENLIEPLTIPQ